VEAEAEARAIEAVEAEARAYSWSDHARTALLFRLAPQLIIGNPHG
jgi:hypothetical protein